jgi:parallel beta-helix repeat protein
MPGPLRLAPLALVLITSAQAQFFGNLQDITPRKFGARCNGTGDDTAGMQRALDASSQLYIPRGFVCITGPLTAYNASFVFVWGGGTIRAKNNANGPLLTINAATSTTPAAAGGAYSWVHDVYIDGNRANQSVAAPCLLLQNAAYTLVNNNKIISCSGDGVVIENRGGNVLADEINVTANHIFSNGGNGVNIRRVQPAGGTFSTTSGSTTVTLLTGTIDANQDKGAQLTVTGCGYSPFATITAIVGNTITLSAPCSTTQASTVFAFAAQGPGDHVITDNHINYNTLNGVLCDYCYATIISQNNILSNLQHGVYLRGSSRNMVNANQIRNNFFDGVYLDRGQDGVTLGYDNQVIGNQLHFNNASAGSSGGIDLWYQQRPILSHNVISDTDFPPRDAFGVQLFNTSGAVLASNVVANILGTPFINNTSDYRGFNNNGIPDAQAATSATWDPPSLTNGSVATTTVATTESCAIGDRVNVGLSTLTTQVMLLVGQVQAANTVRVNLLNQNGGVVDLASGTLKVSCTQ